MADKPESFSGSRVSRRTQVIRKAASEDARRHGVESGRLPRVSGTAPAPKPEPQTASGRQSSGRTTAIIRKDAKLIAAASSPATKPGKRASVRLRSGDTLVRLKSGETLIRRRVVSKAEMRRNVLIAYAIGYVVVFALYAAFLLTATYEMTPAQYLDKAFAKRHGQTVHAMQRAAVEATRSNRTPAEVRFAHEVTFYDTEKDLIIIAAGDRVTLLTASKLAVAILEDLAKPEKNRSFSAPFVLYKENWLAGVDWQYWLMNYNLLGFYLLVALFLWKPISDFLGTQGKKTSIALENARKAQEESEELRDGYRLMAAEIDAKREQMEADLEAGAVAAHDSAIEAAEQQAKDIVGGVETAMAAEIGGVLAKLKTTTTQAACQRAKELLAARVGPEDHNRAIESLIADISAMKLG